MIPSQSVANESLLYGVQERREQLYGADAQQQSSGSASASAHVSQLEFAPPPPAHPLRAGVDQWTEMNSGVQNHDGSHSADMGFNLSLIHI